MTLCLFEVFYGRTVTVIGDVLALSFVFSASRNFMVAPRLSSLSFSIPVVVICSTSVAVSSGLTLTLHNSLYWLPRLFVYNVGVPLL